MNSKEQFVFNRVKSFFPRANVKFFSGEGSNSFVAGRCLYFNHEIIHRLNVHQLQALIDHELAHYKYGHVYVNRMVFLSWIGIGILPWMFIPLSYYFYLAVLSVMAFMIFGWLYRLLIHYQEYAADRYALTYNDRQVMISMLVTISNTDLFKTSFSHPSIVKRINKINGQKV